MSEFEFGSLEGFLEADERCGAAGEKSGVRVSNGEGLWWNCEADQLYTITIESDGGSECDERSR